MMTTPASDFENPFADYGNIVRGERFIGRQDNLRIVENRVIRPREPGNLAIIGEPRIGKSSLVYKSILERKREFIAKRVLPIWINLATYDQAPIFFRSLLTQCYDQLEELGLLSEPVQVAAQRAIEDTLTWSEGYGRIQRFFEKVRLSGFRVLFILDEFDHARHLFKNDVSGFQGLRELSYRPEWRVTFITTSRRTIREIEEQSQAISTFDGIFHKHYLAMFVDSDMEDYFSRLSSVGLILDIADKEQIISYCGFHPYLLEMLGYEVVEVFRETQQVDISKSMKRIESSFLEQYDRMIELLREDGRLNKLLQILLGPNKNVGKSDVEEFFRYGLIKLTHEGIYGAFSDHFQAYLKLIERQIDLWSIWRETELALRSLITIKMVDKYGENWIAELEKSKQNLKKVFDGCRVAQISEEKSFGSRASQNLIDFTYPKDLFDIMYTEWKTTFSSILGKDKSYWDQRAQLLSKVRTPLAHSRDSVLAEHERQIAEGYCKEILAAVEKEL